MNILDEDIGLSQRQQLTAWKIHFRQIGVEIGTSGMKDDEEIIPLLHQLKHPTLFTRDHGFYRPVLRHQGYCLVVLDVEVDETAAYIRRILRYPEFRTQAQRMGKVLRVRSSGVSYWQLNLRRPRTFSW